ncbi:MAG: purine-nucleoside phosphorylase [Clostridia bacterium]|nr:purine-nucleoside phosphorylase [Clostridia bacterium]
MFYDEVMTAVRYIREHVACRPRTAVILGSGLGSIADQLEDRELLPYADIPGFPKSDVSGHAARFVFGTLNGRPIVAMQGRFHYYEGLSMCRLSLPIYVLKQLGVEKIVVTNACGGINPAFSPGDLMLITDHINFAGNNPLIGSNDERFGPRFPDMTEVYDPSLNDLARRAAGSLSIPLREGVYAFFTGPCYETAAEIRAYHILGADAIGMSTVPEAIAANYLGMKVLGIACITNMATGIAKTPHSHEEVLAIASASSRVFCRLLERILFEMAE